ncbi:hypothetical protein D9613_007781 [Agrocybe pediades]|uniref:ASTRA-associated protein 1 n=1 Tax=Agrocybe pediades TaxID=84607 RepID=A0A8H4QM80_9AGAR|nr:hypothetical protein D9613_007781 [Agrocybe pediades]
MQASVSPQTQAQAPPPPPTPLHLLRSHAAPVTALSWSDDDERIYSGDASGKVVVTSTQSLRAIAAWMPHTDSILGVEEWDKYIVTHARDNKIHVWHRIEEPDVSARIGGSAGLPDLPTPQLCYSMDVNALNFCRFSLLPMSDVKAAKALIALPNLIDSTTADIWSIPTLDRVHAAIGQEGNKSTNGGRNSSGIIMSMHLYRPERQNLRILLAYENGSVVLREYTRTTKEASVEGQGWNILWKSKLHAESIMAMRVSRANDFALSVSADHIIGRYDLNTNQNPPEEYGAAFRTKHAGSASVAIREDGKVCAVGGWDGKIRLYSTKSFKPLGTLKYHKTTCHCVEFARPFTSPGNGDMNEDKDDSDEEDISYEEKMERSRWLVAGSKDNRVSIWSLMSFEK